MISHVHLKQVPGVATYWRAPFHWMLDVGCWMLDVPSSRVQVPGSRVQGPDAANIPGSLSSLRSFAAIVSPVQSSKFRVQGSMFPVQRTTHHAPRSTFSSLARSRDRFLNDDTADVRWLNDVNVRARHYKEPAVPGDGDRFTVLDGDPATVVQFEDERLERRGMKQVPDCFDIHGAFKVQGSRFKVQDSKFAVQGLPQKNAKNTKDAAGIALPGSLSSLRSFAAIVSPVQGSRFKVQGSMFDVRGLTPIAHRLSPIAAHRPIPNFHFSQVVTLKS
jgi:hypothetical protein